ncbi:MAG: aspartate-semialdehyde dehydrogenase [Congregibacter sp.]
MTDAIGVAVVGASGAVGEAMIEILEQREFPVDQLHLLASERSAGRRISFRGKQLSVKNLADFDFSAVQIGLFSAGGSVSAQYAPQAVQAGCVVIDNTSHFRRDNDIPLIIPEVNPHAVADFRKRGIIANPNCSTIQMLVALKPLHDAARITRINVATYQAVSGTGKSAIEELAGQTARLLNGQPAEHKVYPKQIAFNTLPHIDTFQENGYTREEMKMVWETQKIFEDETIGVNPTCVRVPVFHGHSEALHIETERKLSAEDARSLLQSQPGIEVIDTREDGGYATQVSDAAGNDAVFVSRIREDISTRNGLNLWVVSDNLRKGAALNSVQIAELLLRDGLLG